MNFRSGVEKNFLEKKFFSTPLLKFIYRFKTGVNNLTTFQKLSNFAATILKQKNLVNPEILSKNQSSSTSLQQ